MTRLIVVLLAVVATASAASSDLAKVPDTQNLMTLSSKDVDVAGQKLDLSVWIANNNNISEGKIGKGDILLAKATYIKRPCHKKVHVQDIVIKGKKNIGITAIQVAEVGATQNSVATIKEGGVGQNYVVIRLQSAKGGGYHYVAEVWGEKLEKEIIIQRQKLNSPFLI